MKTSKQQQFIVELEEVRWLFKGLKSNYVQGRGVNDNELNRHIRRHAALLLNFFVGIDQSDEVADYVCQCRNPEWFEDIAIDVQTTLAWQRIINDPTLTPVWVELIDDKGGLMIHTVGGQQNHHDQYTLF